MDARTILITGGSRGIGRATAEAFLAAGHRVAITGRDPEALAAAAQDLPGVLALTANVTDAARADAVVEEVAASLGPVEVLVNNAGTGGDARGPRPLWEHTVDDWWKVQETNLKGPMAYSRAVLPAMRAAGSGVIINVGSYIAIRPEAGASAYASSKAALARLTDCLAEDLADSGVQVFCVSPGFVLTDMTRELTFIDEIPKSAFRQPSDFAAKALQLASGAHGDLSGCFFHVSDDLEALAEALAARGDAQRSERLHSLCLHGVDGLIP